MKFSKKSKHNSGGAMIATTIIVLFTSLIIAISVQYQGVGELIMSLGDQQSEQAYELAQSCINDAFLKLRTNSNYTGLTQNISSGSCTVSITGSGSNRSISSSATVGQSIRKIITNITISSGTITITSWVEDIS